MFVSIGHDGFLGLVIKILLQVHFCLHIDSFKVMRFSFSFSVGIPLFLPLLLLAIKDRCKFVCLR